MNKSIMKLLNLIFIMKLIAQSNIFSMINILLLKRTTNKILYSTRDFFFVQKEVKWIWSVVYRPLNRISEISKLVAVVCST